MTSPQVESPNQLTIDLADNPDLKEIFYGKDAGDKIKVTMELQLVSKTQELVTLAIEKIITDETETSSNGEAKPSLKEPIMAHMSRGKANKDHPMGKHNRPPQVAENSEEPWRTSYV
jgi:hypothetical protein